MTLIKHILLATTFIIFGCSRQQEDSVKNKTDNLKKVDTVSSSVKPLNLSESYHQVGFLELPFSSSNFFDINHFYKGAIDQKSLAEIRKANYISINKIDNSKCNVPMTDSTLFVSDFSENTTEQFKVTTIGSSEDGKFVTYLIFTENSDNLYIITFELQNRKTDFLSAKDAITVNWGNSVYRGRKAVFLSNKLIELTETCTYSGSDSNQTLKCYVKINENGKIAVDYKDITHK